MEISVVIRSLQNGREARFFLPEDEYHIREKLGLTEHDDFEYIIVDSDYGLVSEHDSIDTINAFAELIDDVSSDVLMAVQEYFGYKAKDFVTRDFDFDTVSLLEDVTTDRELGEYYINEIGIAHLSKDTLESYFDYEAYGRDVAIESSGGFTDYGYLEVH